MDFKIGTIGSYLKDNDGKRPVNSAPAATDGLVIETMGDYHARKAKGGTIPIELSKPPTPTLEVEAVDDKPKRRRKAAAGDGGE